MDSNPMFSNIQRRKKVDGEDVDSEKVDGFWKIIQADIPVKEDGQIIGYKKRLEFSGNQRSETQWRMNEYRLNQNDEESNITEVDMWVVCRIYMCRSKGDEEAWDEDWYFSSDDEEIKLS
ncbi:NAC domain-containing protein 19 [Ziziphus jujuba]|uniref:NAC domain-containing protein 19 n=1 Tax=Ziziphus jujuba TaxID=326968 RepID=A0A6P3ZYM5_ZIZJJ|nr:NAC domain-containing protein 19 [Ziziphus jujuba]XP_048334104.2 NAC domain-containing protein 19 [Ziziphus jujuba]XP_060671282.1 NAC domain-containing protein 19 [Ziziphus jujuba]